MLRIGIVGCGFVAQGHLKAIHSSEAWTLGGIADLDPSRLESIQKKYGLKFAFDDYRKLLDHAELDALVVATHVDSHCRITIDALNRGLHVLCEKPMATTSEDCRSMVAAAEANGGLLAVNFNTRSSPQYRKIKQLIDEGAVGRVRVVRIIYNWSAHQWKPPERLEHFMANGGPLIDSATHFFDGIRWYTGQEFARIDANGVVLPPYEHPQHGIVSCLLEDGGVALVEAGWLYTKRTRDEGSFYQITVIGDDGTLEHDNVSGKLRVWTRSDTRELEMSDIGKHFEITYSAFAKSIERGELVELASGYDGLKATEAAYAALASTKRTPK